MDRLERDDYPAPPSQRDRAFPEQNADGVDLSLIRENLRLSPVERLRRNYRHRLAVQRLNEIGRRTRQESD